MGEERRQDMRLENTEERRLDTRLMAMEERREDMIVRILRNVSKQNSSVWMENQLLPSHIAMLMTVTHLMKIHMAVLLCQVISSVCIHVKKWLMDLRMNQQHGSTHVT